MAADLRAVREFHKQVYGKECAEHRQERGVQRQE